MINVLLLIFLLHGCVFEQASESKSAHQNDTFINEDFA